MWILAYPHIAQVINSCVKHIYFNLFFCSLSIAFQKSKKVAFIIRLKKQITLLTVINQIIIILIILMRTVLSYEIY